MSDLTKFDYLLNAFEQASQHVNPASQGYAQKRTELYAYVRALEAEANLLGVAARHYVAADFVYPQHEGQSCLIIALPHGVKVGASLRDTLARAAAPSSEPNPL